MYVQRPLQGFVQHESAACKTPSWVAWWLGVGLQGWNGLVEQNLELLASGAHRLLFSQPVNLELPTGLN